MFLVPVKGGIGGIVHPPIGRKNATYILPSEGLYATYHLLGEPETTIDLSDQNKVRGLYILEVYNGPPSLQIQIILKPTNL